MTWCSPTRLARLAGVRLMAACACLWWTGAAVRTQPAALPRVVLETAAPTADDLSTISAARRVVLDAPARDADALVQAFDARASRGAVWLTLRPADVTADAAAALVDAVRTLVEARPDIRAVEVAAVATDPRVIDFITRQLSVVLKAARDDVRVARGVASLADLERLAETGVLSLVDVVVVPAAADAAAAAATLSAHGLDIATAVLGLPTTGDAHDVAAREIRRLGGALDVAGYVLPDDPAEAGTAVSVLRTLARPLSQSLTPIAADVRLTTTAGEDVTAAWRTEVLFGTDSLATYVRFISPSGAASTVALRLVLPVSGAASLFEPARGRERPLEVARDDQAQTTTVTIELPGPGTWLVDMNRDADASFVQREDVTAARRLSVDEILARHQLRQAATRRAVQRYIANGTMQQYFRPTVTDPGFDVFTENRYYADGDRVEWEELSFSVNGARWDENRPPFPLLQPEKVLSPPLVIELDRRYRYRLGGTERVDGRMAYVVRFEPIDTTMSLYRGVVWIDTQTFARLKQQVVQTNLVAPVVSNDETQTFAPVTLPDGGEVFLPVQSYTQQLLLIAGRNLLVERRMTFGDYRINPDDFEARRAAARQSERVMYVDTPAGVRYFVKEGDTRVVSDGGTTRAKAQAIGVTIDPSYDFPLPILGINYLNFEFLGRKDTQLALLFGGVLAAGNLQRPQIVGKRVDLNVDFFAIAAPGSDRFYEPDGEVTEARLLTWPLSTGVNLGVQATSYQKLTTQFQVRFDGYVRDRPTAEHFVTPSSTVTTGLGLLYEYRRAGYNVTASGVLARRASWRPWGLPGALEASSPDYEKYALNATNTF